MTFKGVLSNPTADGLPNIEPIFTDGPNTPAKDVGGDVNVEADNRQGVVNLMTFRQVGPGEKTSKPPILLACAGEPGCGEGTGPNGGKVVTLVTGKGSYRNYEIRVGIAAGQGRDHGRPQADRGDQAMS